jgi:hypothetical protein
MAEKPVKAPSNSIDSKDIALQVKASGRSISVNGEQLTLPLDPEKLQTILGLGRNAIIQSILATFIETKQRHPDLTVSPPPLFVIRFGTQSQEKRIFTPKGLDNNTSIHTQIDELKEKYHPYWRAVGNAGFRPEVRSNLTGPSVGGIWLMLHKLQSNLKIRVGRDTYEI